MNLNEAQVIAADLVDQMRLYCERVEIAGSIRRGKDHVKDVEIVCIPKWEMRPDPADLFGEETIRVNLLHEAFSGKWRFIKTGTDEIISWPADPAGKYWRVYLGGVHMKLDIFLCERELWGYIFMLRTGSSGFNEAVARHGLTCGTRYTTDALRGCTAEKQVFDALDLYWVEPQDRTGPEAVQPVPEGNPNCYCVWCRHTSQCDGQCIREKANEPAKF